MKLSYICLPLAALAIVACGDDTKKPAPECKVDTDCIGAALTSCQVAVCNKTSGTCESTASADGTTCTTSNACLSGESCTAGVCAGGTVVAADCGARECGKDACNNSCGACTGSDVCNAAGTCEVNAADCGDIQFEGCCTGDSQVKYCDEGELVVLDCPSNDPGSQNCTWFDGSGFDCGAQASGDSSGEFPYLCTGETACTETCGARECGFACGQACGSGCTGDNVCNAEGACVENPCGAVSFFGCCNADASVTYCNTEAYELVTVDCKAEAGEDATCGWASDEEGYWCVGAQTADPSNTHPYLCGGQECTETCDTRSCGSACGQTCANTCEGGLICEETDGTCVTNPCGNLGFEGCCDGANVFYCSEFTVIEADCVAESGGDETLQKCGWNVAVDEGDVDGYYCGPSEDSDPAGTLLRACSEYLFERPVAEPPAAP